MTSGVEVTEESKEKNNEKRKEGLAKKKQEQSAYNVQVRLSPRVTDTTEWYTESGTHERVKNTAGDATEGTGSHMHRPAGFMRGRGGRLFVH